MVIYVSFFANGVFAAPISQLAEKVFELRSEVEKLGQETDFLRKTNDSEIEPLLARKADLISQMEKEKLRKILFEEKTRFISLEKSSLSSVNAKKESELLQSWIVELENYTNSHIPYRSSQRLQALAILGSKLKNQSSSHLQILDELIKISESELKLVQSKEFRVMPIKLGNKQVLAETVRLGMMQMVFALPNGELGFFSQSETNIWEPVLLTSSDEKKQIQRLISYFKEKKTKGWFMVPIASSDALEVMK